MHWPAYGISYGYTVQHISYTFISGKYPV